MDKQRSHKPHLLTLVSLSLLFLLDISVIFVIFLYGLRDPFLFFLSSIVIHIIISIVLIRLLTFFFPIIEGEFEKNDPVVARWEAPATIGLFSCVLFDQFLPILMLASWYRLFGARLGKGVIVVGRLLECWLVEMSDNSNLGAGAIISCHWINGDKIVIGKVQIKEGAVIGTKSVVSPGTTIGRKAIIGAMAFVPSHTTIPSAEIWCGIPARFKK